jgi:hypothetical protein
MRDGFSMKDERSGKCAFNMMATALLIPGEIQA